MKVSVFQNGVTNDPKVIAKEEIEWEFEVE